MKKVLALLAFVLTTLFANSTAQAQVFFANTRVGTVNYTHAAVGTTAADAIAASSVVANMLAWKICADAGNASYVAVGTAADPDTDGVRLEAGQCMDCPNCTPSTLKDANVKGGAAAQGYAIVQYRQ